MRVHKNPGFIPSMMAALLKQTGVNNYPCGNRLPEFRNEIKDKIVRRRARTLKPEPISVDEEVDRELELELDRRWTECFRACLASKRQLGRLTFDMVFQPSTS